MPASPPSADAGDTSPLSVGLVVITYNSAALLPDFLGSMPDGLLGVQATLVVADNASADETAAIVRELAPDALFVETGGNLGYAGAFNVGARHLPDADALFILNPDIRLQHGCVRQMLKTMSQPDTGIVVPRMLNGDGQLSFSLRHEPSVLRVWAEALLGGGRAARLGLSEVIVDDHTYDQPTVVPWATGAAMLISMQCLDAVGPWDESFFLYSEETDFALRARDHGYVLRYDPAATVVHFGGDAPSSPYLWSLLTVNRVRLFAKRHRRLSTLAFSCGVFINSLVRSIGPNAARHRASVGALLRHLVAGRTTGVRP